MYAVVQHVKQSQTVEGINATLHESRQDLNTIHYQQLDVTPPANNSVESYLEIEYIQGTPRAAIQALLLALHMSVTASQNGRASLTQAGVGRAEFMTLPKYLSRLATEWQVLENRLMAMPL